MSSPTHPMLLTALMLVALKVLPAHAQDDAARSFQTLSNRVIEEFQVLADGVRRVRVDVRRRDTMPEADVRMVGMLRFDVRPKDMSAWQTVRCLFAYRDGRWTLVRAVEELQSEQTGPVEAGPWYQAVVERALQGAQ